MARKRDRRLDSSPSRGRSIDTEKQMRDPFLDRSRLLARRSVASLLRPPRLRTFRNLMTEDLRREARFRQQNLSLQAYRREDGSQAVIVGRQVDTPRMRKQRMPSRLRYEFSDPDRTLVCQRRKTRRAVIFAMQRAGKGGKRNRRARWTEKSRISCRKGR